MGPNACYIAVDSYHAMQETAPLPRPDFNVINFILFFTEMIPDLSKNVLETDLMIS